MKKKYLFSGMVFLIASLPALAATSASPEGSVIKAAKAYISENEDLGGHVDSCKVTAGALSGPTVTEACSGQYHILGPGGGGNFKVDFSCTGAFTKSGDTWKFAKVNCKDNDE